MQKTCKKCQAHYDVTDDDLAFYDKMSPFIVGKKYPLPPPGLCPRCRLQRRLAFRNERNFYHRKADDNGQTVVSIYSPDMPVKVFSQEEWWSDRWNGTDMGRDVDFSRPFFEQFGELWKEVPMIALWNINAENALYNNCSSGMKDSYMNACSDFDRNVMYSYVAEFCSDVMDASFLHSSELCYECVNGVKLFQCFFSLSLENCSDCYFCSDLVGCNHCFGCHGLRHQEYYIYNKKVSPQEWKEKVAGALFTPRFIEESKRASRQVSLSVPKVCSKQVQCEGCRGDQLYRCKHAVDCFDVIDGEETARVIYAPCTLRHSQDAYGCGYCERVYEFLGGVNATQTGFVYNTANGLSNAFYCVLCVNGSSDLFGCIGLKKAKYCVLNKQYTKEEYERISAKLIEHMMKTGEWGETFPPSLSPFGYNQTAAQEMFPQSKEQALERGFRWSEYTHPPLEVAKTIPASTLPDCIEQVPDDILQWAVECEVTRRPFKIIRQELDFYRRHRLPVPRRHPDERHKDRMALRNPRKLWSRTCMKCAKPMYTSYAPDRPEKVYCEECYLKEVY